jgi:hypothetical protein
MSATIKKELSFVLANRPGTLSEVLNALANAKVNLLACDASGGFEYNIVRIVPDKVGKAKAVLRRKDCDVGEANVICVSAKDCPGALAEVASTLGRAGINMDYLYATGGMPGGDTLLVVHVSDSKKALRLLK